MTGIWRSSCATPSGGLLFGHLAESTPLTGYKPKTCIDVNSEHTPLNYTSRRNSFNIENNDLTTTTAASDNSDGFHQQAAASGGPQRAPGKCGKPMAWRRHVVQHQENWCEVMSHFQVLKGLCREEKEIKIWKVCKVCPKGKIFMSTLSRKLNWLFKENAKLRKRLSEAEAQIGQKEIENKDENSHLKDWNCVRRINGQIRLKEKRLIFVEGWK